MKWDPSKVTARAAVLMTIFLFPGAGQMLTRQWGKAIAFAVLAFGAFGVFAWYTLTGLWQLYKAATTMSELPDMVALFSPALWPLLALVPIYLGAAWDAWMAGKRAEQQAASE